MSFNSTSSGHPIKVASLDNDGDINVDLTTLKDILYYPATSHLPTVVVSITTENCHDTPILLDKALQFLNPKTRLDCITPVTWYTGFNPKPTEPAITIWSKPYIVKMPGSDTQMSIFLMHTQGLNLQSDGDEELAKAFTILQTVGTTIASVQFFEINGQLKLEHLVWLRKIYELRDIGPNEAKQQPFGRVVFVLKEWLRFNDTPVGYERGNNELAELLEQAAETTTAEQTNLLREMRKAYSQLDCFALPSMRRNSPGLGRGMSQEYCPSYLQSLEELLADTLTVARLKPKLDNLELMTSAKLFDLLKTECYGGQVILDDKSWANAKCRSVMKSIWKMYRKAMVNVLNKDHPYVDDLDDMIEKVEKDCWARFSKKTRHCDDEVTTIIKNELIDKLNHWSSDMEDLNEAKNLYKKIGVPVLLGFIVIVLYWISSLFYKLQFDKTGFWVAMINAVFLIFCQSFVLASMLGIWRQYVYTVECLGEPIIRSLL